MSSLYQVQDLTVAWKGYSFPSSCVFCLWPIWYKSMRVILLKCGSHSGAPKLGSFQRSINVQTPQLWCPEPPPHLLRRLLTPPDFHFYSVDLPLCPASETGFRQFFFVSSIFSALLGWEKDFGHWKHYIQRQRSGLTLVSEKETPLRGISSQSLGQRSRATPHKALSVSPNSSRLPVPGTWRAAPSPCPPTTTASSPAAWTSRSPPTAATGRSPWPPSCCPTGPTTTRAATWVRHGGPRGFRFRFRFRPALLRLTRISCSIFIALKAFLVCYYFFLKFTCLFFLGSVQ